MGQSSIIWGVLINQVLMLSSVIGKLQVLLIKSLVNDRSLQLECVRALYYALLMPVLLHGNETITRREKERPMIMVLQMDSFIGLLGTRKMDRMLNAQIRKLCQMMAGMMKELTKVFSDGSFIFKK